MNNNTCKYCSKDLNTSDKRRRYCNDECRKKQRRDEWRELNSDWNKMVTITCEHCGKEHEVPPRTAHQARFCSSKCRDTWWSREVHGHKPIEEHLEDRRKQAEINREMKENERKKRLIETTRVGSCKVCGGGFTTLQPSQVTCSTQCSNKWRNRNKDKRINKSNLVDADITLEKLFKRDGGTCYICGGECDFNDDHTTDSGHWYAGEKYPSIDHLLPLARDGKHAWDNIRLACRSCNTMKSDALIEDILEHVPDNAYALKETKQGTPPKRTAQYDLAGNLIAVYESTGEASRETNIKRKGIQNCARGECKTYKGFVWSYK